MNPILTGIAVVGAVVAVVAAGASVACVVRNQLPGWVTTIALAVLEVVLIVALVANLIAYLGTDVAVDGVVLIAYLVVEVVLVPASVIWAFVDRTRYGVAAIAVACAVVPVLLWRTYQIWEVAGVA